MKLHKKLHKFKAARFVMLLPVAVSVALAIVLLNMISQGEATILSEKLLEKRMNIDWVCDYVERDVQADQNDGHWFARVQTLARMSMELLNMYPGTYAASFDSNLNPLSVGTYNEQVAALELNHPDFAKAAISSDSGSLTLESPVDGGLTDIIYVYYRWTPRSADPADRILLTVAITDDAVQHRFADAIGKRAVEMALLVAAVNILVTVLLTPENAEAIALPILRRRM